MKRSKFSLSNYKLMSTNMGRLVPVNLTEVLPGDTIQQSTSCLVRCSPLVAPVMHPVQVRIHHWFVPMRIIWPQFEEFITGGVDGLGDGTATVPTINPGVAEGDVLDHLGIPPNGANQAFSALPLYAYNKIYNEWYRDPDMTAEVPNISATTQLISWEKDYFTTARPWPQRGPGVTVPISGTGVLSDNTLNFTVLGAGTPLSTDNVVLGANVAGGGDTHLAWNDGGVLRDLQGTVVGSVVPNTLATDVLALREALGLQRYREARARYGSRYTEYLRYLGITPADSRLQRPEYLGGGRQTIAFSEVLQTSNDGANGDVGDMAGHGIAAVRSNRYRKFFQEHGYIMTLLSIRPKSVYMDGMPRTFTRSIKEDFFQRELQDIGQQEVQKREVYAAGTAADLQTWAYQDRYDEYRRQLSGVSGDFRSTLNFWHMARDFSSLPTLNAAFVNCDPGRRNFAVTDPNTDTIWCMAHNHIAARRMVKGSGGNSRIL